MIRWALWSVWYYMLAARAVLVVAWGYLFRGAAFRQGVRAAIMRETFTELAVKRGAARPDIAAALFGQFGELPPAEAIQAARVCRADAASDGFTSHDVGTFRRRMTAQNVLRCAVDLGLIPPSDLAGLVAE